MASQRRRTCSFCGWYYSDLIQRGGRGGGLYFIKCCGCNARGPEADTKEEASKLWDTTRVRLNGQGMLDNTVPMSLVPVVLYEE